MTAHGRNTSRPIPQGGFTLAELLMVTLISFGAAGTLLVVSIATSNTVSSIRGQGLLQMELSLAMDSIAKDVRRTTTLPTLGDGGITLLLQLPTVNANNLVVSNAFDTVTYHLDTSTSTLQRILDANDAQGSRQATASEPDEIHVVANDITNVTFAIVNTPPASPVINVTLTGSRTERGFPYTLTITGSTVLRNT